MSDLVAPEFIPVVGMRPSVFQSAVGTDDMDGYSLKPCAFSLPDIYRVCRTFLSGSLAVKISRLLLLFQFHKGNNFFSYINLCCWHREFLANGSEFVKGETAGDAVERREASH